MDEAWIGLTPLDSHLEGSQRQITGHPVRYGPADNPAVVLYHDSPPAVKSLHSFMGALTSCHGFDQKT